MNVVLKPVITRQVKKVKLACTSEVITMERKSSNVIIAILGHLKNVHFRSMWTPMVVSILVTYAKKNILQDDKRTMKVCQFCDSFFRDSSNLKKHIERMHKCVNKEFKCALCIKVFKSRNGLNCHTKAEHLQVNHQCEFCDKKFKYEVTLKNHIVRKHSKNETIICDFCPFTCFFKMELTQHKKRHENKMMKDKNHQDLLKCNHCTFKTMIKVDLSKHVKRHEKGMTGHKISSSNVKSKKSDVNLFTFNC